MLGHHESKLNSFYILIIIVILSIFYLRTELSFADQNFLQKTLETVDKEIQVHKRMQKRSERWSSEKEDLKQRYNKLLSQKERLAKKKNELTQKLDLQRKKVNRLNQTVKESKQVKKELLTTLKDIVNRLEDHVQRDLPFLLKERNQRLNAINELLIDPDQSLAEKTRRVFEALQVELDYGLRFEVIEKDISLAGEEIAVDVLRVGRLSLLCRNREGSLVGWYVPAKEKWEFLPDKYSSSIQTAMEIAGKRRAADLVKLPLGQLEVQ